MFVLPHVPGTQTHRTVKMTCPLVGERRDQLGIAGRMGEGAMARGTGLAPCLSLRPPAGHRQGARPMPTWGRFPPQIPAISPQ